jgi:hypothetical protein
MSSPKKARRVSLLVSKLFYLLRFGCFVYGSNYLYRELFSLYTYIYVILHFFASLMILLSQLEHIKITMYLS